MKKKILKKINFLSADQLIQMFFFWRLFFKNKISIFLSADQPEQISWSSLSFQGRPYIGANGA